MSATRYVLAPTIDEAARLLASDPQARPLAGGYGLLLPKNRSAIAGSVLIDLGRLPELAKIQLQSDGSLRIGAMVTIGAMASDKIVRERFPALAEAAELIGDAQVRNRATLGGNLAASDPESDLPALMLALEATFAVQGRGGSRSIPADQFFTGPQQTAITRDELITSALLPSPSKSTGVAYEKFKHPATLYALCGVAGAVTLGKDGEPTAIRIGATGALSHPMRLRALEEAIFNRPTRNGALPLLPSDFTFRDDLFASAEYRQHLLGVLTRRALKRAFERATG